MCIVMLKFQACNSLSQRMYVCLKQRVLTCPDNNQVFVAVLFDTKPLSL